MNIYEKLKKPIYSLAPMDDVTDSVFRQVVCKCHRPDLMYTEFVNVDGLMSKGKNIVMRRLKYSDVEKPLIVQLWGRTPENFLKSAELVSGMGFDGIDINMGCSVKRVANSGGGSALINEKELAKEIVLATKEGSNGLPISVKTRLGWDDIDMDWISTLLHLNLDALNIHCRTARGDHSIHANWRYISNVIDLRNEISPNTLIFGNGDINSMREAKDMIDTYHVDGVMIGRGSISNPWVFSEREDISLEERIDMFRYHLDTFDEVYEYMDFNVLKKFFRSYINGFDGANDIRKKLMDTKNTKEVRKILEDVV